MPNHIHGVLILTGVGAIQELPVSEKAIHERAIHERAIRESPLRDERRKMLIAKIIGRFKMTTGKQINLLRKTSGTAFWQRNYYEHIIRNKEAFVNIENYILDNPANWERDTEYRQS